MKLLHLTGRYYLIFSILIFILSGIGLFSALKYVVGMESDEQLMDSRVVLKDQLEQLDSIPRQIALLDHYVEITPVDNFDTSSYFLDTSFWNGIETEHESPYRKFVYYDSLQGKPFRIALNRNTLDTEEMLTTIVFWIVGILSLMLVMINLFNRYLSLQIWKPFYQSINQLKKFTFKNKSTPEPVITNIDEFKTLQEAINRMTDKSFRDYQSLKRFTENASHEVQTPLAIIKNKIELLIQQEDLSKSELHDLWDIQRAANRISKLNQSLVLLTRIENEQFANTQKINISNFIVEIINQLEPMLSAKQLTVEKKLTDVYLNMDPILVEVLLQNLLGNAVKHNFNNGEIDIHLTKNKLRICNTGNPLDIDTQLLFERFRKGTNSSSSLGLGLAVVQEICTIYNFNITYKNTANQHCIDILFLKLDV